MTVSARIPVCFDATRLQSRLHLDSPTGIDRVDLAYLQAFSAADDLQLSLVVRGPLGPKQLPASTAAKLVARLQGWQAASGLATASGIDRPLWHWLESAPGSSHRPRELVRAARSPLGTRLRGLLARARPDRPDAAARAELTPLASAGRGTIYVNTSHGQLYRAAYDRWLAQPGLRSLFFVHDLIPLRYPEYSRATEPGRHAARLATIARHAAGVLVNSQATAADLRSYWRQQGLRAPPISVLPLGLHPSAGQALPVPQAERPYFVMLGTIEARKNHLLMLKLWQRMVEADPATAPRLILLGRRGWENQAVFSLLDRGQSLRGHVRECAGLDDAQVQALLRGARALLNPSFAEGYGLPVAEALALGVPVLASDLPAHREVGGATAEYLDPLDGPAWLAAIHDYAAARSSRRADALRRTADFEAPGWDRHFERLLVMVRKLYSRA